MDSTLCGPSNPAKSLLNHLNGNRAASEYRHRPSSTSSDHGNFREAPVSNGYAQAAFDEFMAPVAPPFVTHDGAFSELHGLASGHNRGDVPINASARYYGGAPFSNQPPLPFQEQLPPKHAWVADFNKMQLDNGNTEPDHLRIAALPAGMAGTGPFALRHQAHLNNYNAVPRVNPDMQIDAQLGSHGGSAINSHASVMSMEELFEIHRRPIPAPPSTEAASAVDLEPERKYEIYSKDINDMKDSASEDEIKVAKKAYNLEFEAEEDYWTSRWDDGPEIARQVDPKAANHYSRLVEEEKIMTHIANEQDAQRRLESSAAQSPISPAFQAEQQSQLAEAATGCLSAVDGETNERMKETSFMKLMARLGAGEIVLQGEELVDRETGEAIVKKIPVEDKLAKKEGE